ncbi:MAG: IS1182 family transposase [Oscillospiraceae bacterium]|nr:IS1182 family transposase [Oscillospiraceae bacterium]
MQLLIDESFAEKVIPADDSVRLLDRVIEELDITPLMRAYDPLGRPPATPPRTMLKIVLYAGMEQNRAARKIRSSCERDINYIWLLNGAPAPSHFEIARFRSKRLTQCGEEIFAQIVKLLHDMGEIEYEHLFVDGTKIEANANKYSFVWKKSTNKYETRLDERLQKLLPELCKKHGVMANEPGELLAQLEERVDFPFVYGRGRRKSELQRDIELLRGLLTRKEKYQSYDETFRGRNSFSKTDPDATFMHMKEDHMRNAQLKPGYNVQFGVEGEYITGVLVSPERSDQLTLIPLMEKMQGYGADYKDVTADAGYESEENYSWFEEKQKPCYIKPQNYERSKTKKYKSNMALRENMAYDAEKDEYTCQAGQKLRVKYVGNRKSKSGFESEITYYECDDCSGCPHKKTCTRAKGNRQIHISKRFIEQRAESLKRITSERGILLRMNRSIQSEGAFGVVKQDYGFRQFLLRGQEKVTTEIFLLAMAYNINKLHAKIQQNRTGKQLFKKVTA